MLSGTAPRIDVCAARLQDLAMWLVPIGRPLPDVAYHVIQPIVVWRERAHRRRPLETVPHQIAYRELTLPSVRHNLAIRFDFIAPCVLGAVETASSRELPLRLCRQLFVG